MEGVEVTDRSFWAGRRVLVTGHTGFKGAWLSLWLERLGAQVTGLALPPESPDGAFSVFTPWPSLESHLADLRDADAVEGVIEATAPEVVFHLAAQSLVGRGWAHPADTYAVNVVGTAHLLEAVSRVRSVQAVVVVTSDKVYANNGTGGPFREDSPLGGADPYSASKAATEHVVTAWRAGNPEVPIATVRAGNVIGGGDVADDRLLPDAWRALLAAKDFVVRHPDATRPVAVRARTSGWLPTGGGALGRELSGLPPGRELRSRAIGLLACSPDRRRGTRRVGRRSLGGGS